MVIESLTENPLDPYQVAFYWLDFDYILKCWFQFVNDKALSTFLKVFIKLILR